MRRRGFTLAELLIASSLLLLAGILGLQILRPAFQSSARHSARAEMQQQAADALERMAIDLERSSMAGVTLLPGSGGTASGLAFQRVDGFESSGSQRYETQLRVFAWNPTDGNLVFFTWKVGQAPALTYNPSLDTASRLSRADFDTLMRNPPRPVALLTAGVASWTMEQVGNGVKLNLLVRRQTPGPAMTVTPYLNGIAQPPTLGPHTEQFTLSRLVALPNGA